MNIQHFNPRGVHQPTGYTHVVRVLNGDLLVISGQVALDADGHLVGERDLRAQATQVFENIKTILTSAEADFSSVIKLTIYVVNYQAEDRSLLVEIRDRYVDQERPPASTLVGVQSLASPEFMIEVEAWAVISGD